MVKKTLPAFLVIFDTQSVFDFQNGSIQHVNDSFRIFPKHTQHPDRLLQRSNWLESEFHTWTASVFLFGMGLVAGAVFLTLTFNF